MAAAVEEVVASWPELLARIPEKITWVRPEWSDELRASIDGYFPSIEDFLPIAIATVLFSIVRPIVQYVFLRSIASRSGFDRDKQDKFSEAAFQVLYYTPIMIWGISICWRADWYWSFDFWKGCPNHPMSAEMRMYYIIQFAFYVHSIVFLFAETRKKDFVAMLTHHIATSMVMLMAYSVNYHRIGVAVLMVHDPADVFLNLAKLFKYYDYQRSTDSIFVVFTLTWILTRLTLFPCLVLSSWGELEYRLGTDFVWPDTIASPMLLTILLILHVYWFYLIVGIALKGLKKKGVEGDVREMDLPPKKESGKSKKRD